MNDQPTPMELSKDIAAPVELFYEHRDTLINLLTRKKAADEYTLLTKRNLEGTHEWKAWQEALDNAAQNNNAIEEVRAKLIETGGAIYQVTKNADLAPGIKVKIQKSVTIVTDKAIEWCRKNLPAAISEKLDDKKFSTYVKDFGGVPEEVATVKDVPQVTITSDPDKLKDAE